MKLQVIVALVALVAASLVFCGSVEAAQTASQHDKMSVVAQSTDTEPTVCGFGEQLCSGQCGRRCYRPSSEKCLSGKVCAYNEQLCGCRCYKPSAGETCNE